MCTPRYDITLDRRTGGGVRKPATHGPQGPALPFMAAQGAAAHPAQALPRPGQERAEPLGVPGLA